MSFDRRSMPGLLGRKLSRCDSDFATEGCFGGECGRSDDCGGVGRSVWRSEEDPDTTSDGCCGSGRLVCLNSARETEWRELSLGTK